MTTPPTLWCCPSFGLDSKSIGQRNGTLQVWTKFVPSMVRLVHSIVLLVGFSSKPKKWLLPHVMMLPKFQARSEINWSKKLDTSSSYEVRTVQGVVGAFRCSICWISPKTHQMTSPTILWCCPSFGLHPKSIGQRNGTLKVPTKFIQYMVWWDECTVLVVGFHSKLTKWHLPPYYHGAQV